MQLFWLREEMAKYEILFTRYDPQRADMPPGRTSWSPGRYKEVKIVMEFRAWYPKIWYLGILNMLAEEGIESTVEARRSFRPHPNIFLPWKQKMWKVLPPSCNTGRKIPLSPDTKNLGPGSLYKVTLLFFFFCHLLPIIQIPLSCQFVTYLSFVCLKGMKASCSGHFFGSLSSCVGYLMRAPPDFSLDRFHNILLEGTDLQVKVSVRLKKIRKHRICCLQTPSPFL